jgi:hypothetical protein
MRERVQGDRRRVPSSPFANSTDPLAVGYDLCLRPIWVEQLTYRMVRGGTMASQETESRETGASMASASSIVLILGTDGTLKT